MNTIKNIIAGKLWTLGVYSVTAAGSDLWKLYYCVEGDSVKHWNILLYNPDQAKVALRSPMVDVKLCGVIIQASRFISNVYSLMLEGINGDELRFWDPLASVDNATVDSGGIVAPGICEEYKCAPSILRADAISNKDIAWIPLPTSITHPADVDVARGSAMAYGRVNVAGYSIASGTYIRAIGSRTRIPSITVNSRTLDCSFAIVTSTSGAGNGKKGGGEASSARLLAVHISNLLINPLLVSM